MGSEQAASSLWDDSHVGGQYADLGYIAPQPPGKHDDETAAGQQWDTGYGDEYADPRDASSGKPDGGSPGGGTAVRSGQADKSEWDTGDIGDQYANLEEVSPQPPGNYDDAMTGGSPSGAAGQPPARPADNAETKMSDEFAGIIGLARSIGAEVSELPDADAAAFKTRLAAILAQRDPADAAGQAR
ncbi:MAG: hypothetical protein EB833_00680, partial [Thaumarchaeota archaeon S13]